MGHSTAYIEHHKKVKQRVANMTFHQIADLVCNLEGTVAQLELQIPKPEPKYVMSAEDEYLSRQGRTWYEND